jgi:hypothetical protein
MTKQEVIQEVYRHDHIHADVNGWMRLGMYVPNDLGFSEEDIERNEDLAIWRPKSLQGIEQNNGWIKGTPK